MKIYLIVIALFLITSCNNSESILQSDVTEVFSSEQIKLGGFLGNYLVHPENTATDLSDNIYLAKNNTGFMINELTQSLELFSKTRKRSDLEVTFAIWEKLKNSEDKFTHYQSVMWNASNARLLQITGKAKYATVLSETVTRLSHNQNSIETVKEVIEKIVPIVFTKDIDNVYVNIYTPSEIHFEHSLGGEVGIQQNIEDLNSGNVELHFNMEVKQYLELYIRIPEWAKNASVVVKKVKYLAIAGEYCKIAKKWKEGDIVEISFKPT